MKPHTVIAYLRSAFWAVPTACAVAAGLLALLAAFFDRRFGSSSGLLYAGGPESARQILSVVASSVLTFAGLTFSITIVALQLASSQFSPRVLRSLLSDRWTQASLGIFVGTFVFALLTLREVRNDLGEGSFVPGLGVTLTLVLGLASIAGLMGFVHHMAQSLRVVTIIDRISRDTRNSLDDWFPEDASDRSATMRLAPGDTRVLSAVHDGALTRIQRHGLVSLAGEDGVTLQLLVAPGTWVLAGQPLVEVTGETDHDERIVNGLALGRERETADDPAYGLRQLVDIAERALSPGVNDPTTAVQCLDRIHGLLRRVACRDLAVGDHVVDGVLRLRIPVPTWADLVALACDEIRHWGAGSVRVHRRMEAMLLDLRALVPVERRPVVEDQLARLERRREGDVAWEWEVTAAAGDPAERPVTDSGTVGG